MKIKICKATLLAIFMLNAGISHSGTSDVSGVVNLLAPLYFITHPLEYLEYLKDRPKREKELEYISRATRDCEKSIAALPDYIYLEDYVDEGGGNTTDTILKQLSNGNIKSIYSRLRPSPNAKGRNKFAWGGDQVGEWSVPDNEVGSYIKLGLASADSQTCLPDKWMPSNVKEKLNSPPFMPGTCITGKLTDSPETPYHLRYIPNGTFMDFNIGKWVIENTKTNEILVFAPSTEKLGGPYPGWSCLSSHYILLNKIRSINKSDSPFVITEQTINLSPSPNEIIGGPDQAKKINVKQNIIEHINSDDYLKFNPGFYSNWWSALVEKSKENGFSHTMNLAFSAKTRLLTKYESKAGWPWKILSTSNGVFVLSWGSKSNRNENWLIHYDLKGSFISKYVVLEQESECSSSPGSIEIKKNAIFLYGLCGQHRGVVWEIQKKDLGPPL